MMKHFTAQQAVFTFLCLSLQTWSSVAFVPQQHHNRWRYTSSSCNIPFFLLVDPSTIGTVFTDVNLVQELGVVLASAAAGAATQFPRLQSQDKSIQLLQQQLNTTEIEFMEKVTLLEDKLFAMDTEFEEQTVRFQKDYDDTQTKRLEEIKEKLKSEMQFKLEIQLAQQKSEGLMKAVSVEHGRTTQQQELLQLQRQSVELQTRNAELERILEETDTELEVLREKAKKMRKGFNFWSTL